MTLTQGRGGRCAGLMSNSNSPEWLSNLPTGVVAAALLLALSLSNGLGSARFKPGNGPGSNNELLLAATCFSSGLPSAIKTARAMASNAAFSEGGTSCSRSK